VLQRERHGTLLVDVEHKLDLYCAACGRTASICAVLHAFDEIRKPIPYYDKLGIAFRTCTTTQETSLASTATVPCSPHRRPRRWSEAQIADNWSPFQAHGGGVLRGLPIETLLIREYPGLRRIFLACIPSRWQTLRSGTTSCLRHRMAMLSRALLDPHHGYTDADLNDFVARFHAIMDKGESSTKEMPRWL